MKIIIPFFASLFLAAMSFAQEESPAPTESTAPATEEKASATVETTPEATVPEMKAAPAQKKEEPVAAAMPAKAAKKEAAATTTTAKPAAAPAESTGKQLTGEAAIKDMENKWEASVPTHNYSMVEGYVSADFMGVSSKGKFVNRSQMLSDYKGDKDTYKSAKNEKLNVRMYGPNLAV